LHAYLSEASCPSCLGTRLRQQARTISIREKSIADVVNMNIETALAWIRSLSFTGEQKLIAAPLIKAIQSRLQFMNQVGVGYLTLNRSSASLSGGEAQRIRLATQVGSGLVGVCYVLDEPTIGLHQCDSSKLVETLRHLRDLGNTVIVVEHDEETIEAADHVIDMGPGAGVNGGEITFSGPPSELLTHENSLTGLYLSGRRRI